jgi:hypothetical protein
MKDATRASLWGCLVAGLVLAGIWFGSRHLRDFDTALVSYAGASVFSAFGIGYRYSMWLRRPPTRLYWRRGWQLFLAPRRIPGNVARLAQLFWNNIVAQKFNQEAVVSSLGRSLADFLPALYRDRMTPATRTKSWTSKTTAVSRSPSPRTTGARTRRNARHYRNVVSSD